MDSKVIIFALGVAVGMLPLLITKLVSFFRAFAEDARFICRKMRCVDSYAEYRRLRDELRCHYLCLIPFVNKKNVMRVYRFFFHGRDRAKKAERKNSVALPLVPSIPGICICIVCICSMTWAWYATNIQSPLQKMTVAHYEVTVESVIGGDQTVTPEGGGYALTGGTKYAVTLKAAGTVQKCGGYCLIELSGSETKYYTQSILPDSSITIVFTPTETGTYTFTGVWGSHPVDVDEDGILKATESVDETEAPTDGLDTDTTESTEPATVSTEPPTETVDAQLPTEEPDETEPPTQETTPEESTESTEATDPAPTEESETEPTETSGG